MMAIVYFFVKDYLALPSLTLSHLWLLIIVPISILLYFLFCVLTGFSAFFTTRTGWFEHGWWMIQTVACGYLAPLAFYPEWAQNILSYTPFSLLIQTPLMIALNQLSAEAIINQILLGIAWIIILTLILVPIWKKGIKTLESVGI
jgi:ABC-2 type transport system permease protein